MRNGYRVIDVDSHVTPSLEVLHRYAGQAIRDRWDEFKPYVREMNSPAGRGHPLGPWHTLKVNPIPYNRIAGHKAGEEKIEKGGAGAVEGRVENISSAECHERIQHDNPEGRLEDMTTEGVDVNVLIPGTWAPASSSFAPALTTGLYDAYHNYMRDFCSPDTNRLKGLFLAPGNDVAWAASELKRIGGESWISAVWPSLPEGMPIDDPDLDPLWEVMNDLHLPIMHHSFFYEPPYFPGARDIWGNAAIARTAAHPWGAQRSLAYVIAGGILDRYPNIKVGYAETGHGWLPFWLLRLDSQIHYVKGVVPKLKYLPTEYAKMGRIAVCIEAHEGPDMTKACFDILGDTCLMYSSDFPHPECDWPHSVDNVLKWKDTLGETRMRNLLSANADAYLRMGTLSRPDEYGVDYRTAMTYVEAAKKIAADRGTECSVAVLDAAGHPVVVARGKEDAWHGPYMAAGKARLSAAFRKSTKVLIEQWADRPLYPMSLTEIIPGGVTLNPGGYPIFVDGVCVGAIGVGGGSPEVDDAIARDAVAAVEKART